MNAINQHVSRRALTHAATVAIALSAAASVSAQWQLNGTDLYYLDGTVNIGTDTPNVGLLYVISPLYPYAIHGHATTQYGAGLAGFADGPDGHGLVALATSQTGVNCAVYGHTASDDGYSCYFGGGRSFFQSLVGISTQTPNARLHVQNSAPSGLVFNANDQFYVSQTTGLVGVNRYTPITDDEVFGLAKATNGYAGMYIETNELGDPFYGYSAGGDVDAFHFFDGGNQQWKLNIGGVRLSVNRSDGYVGIGTSSPAFRLHVTGTAGKPGGGSWSATSDARLKKNVHTLDGALDSLLALRGVSFEYIDPESIDEPPGERIGVIAQEVESVFPDWVETRGDGFKTVTFRGFEALTIEALRELQTRNDRLVQENQELRDRLAALERLVVQHLNQP